MKVTEKQLRDFRVDFYKVFPFGVIIAKRYIPMIPKKQESK